MDIFYVYPYLLLLEQGDCDAEKLNEASNDFIRHICRLHEGHGDRLRVFFHLQYMKFRLTVLRERYHNNGPPALLLPRGGSHHVRGKHDGTAGHAAGRHRRKDRLSNGGRSARAVDRRCHQSNGTALCLPRTETVQQRGNLAERPDSACLPDFRRGGEERFELLRPDAAEERRRPHLFHRPAPGCPAAEDGHGRREAIPAEQIGLCLLVEFQQMLQIRVIGNTLQFIGHNLPGFLLDAVVVLLHPLLHAVDAVGIPEVGDDGYLPVSPFFFRHLPGIDHNLAMEYLLLDFLAEVVRHRTDEHALRQRGNLARRNQAVHLRGDGGGHIVAVDGDRLPFLENLAEPLGERLGGLAHDLPGEDVADGVDDDLRLLVGIVADELREVLKAQQHGHLVAACRSDKVVQPLDEHGGQLVDDDGAFQPALLVHQLDDARVVQTECRPINRLPVGVVADAEHLRLVGVVDVEGELVGGHHPIERR